MPKECIICSEEAEYGIKNINEFYCKDCAEPHFGDIDLLIRVEKDAQKLKRYIEEKGFK
ncbi:MAG: hypothetical protein KAK00_07970 [Nanoarchaeota archaeon]|nr:hypothetical protein [Nanoarchaeota archaeon]